MCGITGIVHWGERPLNKSLIELMNARIAHRGPDSAGTYLSPPVGLGHRRLAIIDLATGAQPMSDSTGNYTLVFNGEIYNYKELRELLKQKGYSFRSTSDTEVVLYSYIAWGKSCVERFRGMFAFAVDDKKAEKVFLARDHFGIKPLLYHHHKDYFAFASELPAISALSKTTLTGSLQALDYYLRLQYIPAPFTIYNEVKKLLPGHRMEVSYSGEVSTPERYYQFTWSDSTPTKSEKEWLELADHTLHESVKAHLVADVPFGVYLSGGIDSTLMAWKMRKILDAPVKAFTIGFDDPLYSELPYARIAAQKLGVELITEIIFDDSLYQLPGIISHFGEPFGDSSVIPTWYVSRLARAHVPMVISGDGADELFGGYGSYQAYFGANPLQYAHAFHPGQPLKAIRRAFRAKLKQWTGKPMNSLDRWMNIVGYVHKQERLEIWKPGFKHVIEEEEPYFEQLNDQMLKADGYQYPQFMDINTYMTFDILSKVDIASMSHGLEVRPPMIDVEVAKLAAMLPLEMKLNLVDGKPTGKYLLKKLLAQTMPHDFVFRKKQGFAIPRDKWLSKGNIGHSYFGEMVLGNTHQVGELFDKKVLEKFYSEQSRENDHSNMLWLFLVFGIWSEQNPTVVFK